MEIVWMIAKATKSLIAETMDTIIVTMGKFRMKIIGTEWNIRLALTEIVMKDAIDTWTVEKMDTIIVTIEMLQLSLMEIVRMVMKAKKSSTAKKMHTIIVTIGTLQM